jgi:meiotic recombination protein SPO11
MTIPSFVYDAEDQVTIQIPKRSDGLAEGQHTVLVVEKSTVFQRLMASKFVQHSRNTVTLVTGGGYPDLPTRRFVALCHQAGCRVLGVADCDPFGIEIMAVYKWGSFAHARETQMLAASSLEWVGLKPQDLGDYLSSSTANSLTAPLLPLDSRKIESLIKRLEKIEGDEAAEWLAQVQLMKELHCKCELEILHVRLILFMKNFCALKVSGRRLSGSRQLFYVGFCRVDCCRFRLLRCASGKLPRNQLLFTHKLTN